MGSCDWGPMPWGLFVEWGQGVIFESREVNAYKMCASVTNKQ